MTADDIFGPETEEEKAKAKDHPVMAVFTAQPQPQGFFGQLLAALGAEQHGS